MGAGELYMRRQKHSNKDLTDTKHGGRAIAVSLHITFLLFLLRFFFLPLKITLLGGESLSKAETTNLFVFRLKSY